MLHAQVADMRWGVTDEVQSDQQTTQLVLKEIDNCHQVSCGPYYVVSNLMHSINFYSTL